MLSHRILFIGEWWHGNKTLRQWAALVNSMPYKHNATAFERLGIHGASRICQVA